MPDPAPDAHSPRYNADGSIDLVLIHPSLGDIPTTARDGDPGSQAVYDKALAGDYGEIAPWVAPELTPEERRAEILRRLAQIDQDSIRPLRAIADGRGEDYDRQKLAKLDSEAGELRVELAALPVFE
jgi:hypothetical protein